jgi:hypothetical protein
MENCIEGKTPRELKYYEIQVKREKIILDAIKHKMSTSKDFDLDLKNEIKKMASYIFWGLKDFHCYYKESGELKTKEELGKEFTKIIKKY